jgi:hypothetical protein
MKHWSFRWVLYASALLILTSPCWGSIFLLHYPAYRLRKYGDHSATLAACREMMKDPFRYAENPASHAELEAIVVGIASTPRVGPVAGLAVLGASEGLTQHTFVLDKDDPRIPEAIRRLQPNLVIMKSNWDWRYVELRFGGGFFHYSLTAFPEDGWPPGNGDADNKELIKGLWYWED